MTRCQFGYAHIWHSAVYFHLNVTTKHFVSIRQIMLRQCGGRYDGLKMFSCEICSFNSKHGPNASVPRKMDRCVLFVGHWANGRTVHFLWYTIAGSYGSGECTDTRRDVQVVEKKKQWRNQNVKWRSLVSSLVRWSRGLCTCKKSWKLQIKGLQEVERNIRIAFFYRTKGQRSHQDILFMIHLCSTDDWLKHTSSTSSISNNTSGSWYSMHKQTHCSDTVDGFISACGWGPKELMAKRILQITGLESTPWKITGWKLHITYLERKMMENDLPKLHDCVPAINLQGCI